MCTITELITVLDSVHSDHGVTFKGMFLVVLCSFLYLFLVNDLPYSAPPASPNAPSLHAGLHE